MKTKEEFERDLFHALKEMANYEGYPMITWGEFNGFVKKAMEKLRMCW